MVKILNPCGWKGALNVLTWFESKLRSELSQTALVWSTTGGFAIISKPYKKRIGLLLQLIADQNLVELRIEKLCQNILDPDFSDRILEASEEIVQRLLTNHCSKLGLTLLVHCSRAFFLIRSMRYSGQLLN
jgi:hypothetical protein